MKTEKKDYSLWILIGGAIALYLLFSGGRDQSSVRKPSRSTIDYSDPVRPQINLDAVYDEDDDPTFGMSEEEIDAQRYEVLDEPPDYEFEKEEFYSPPKNDAQQTGCPNGCSYSRPGCLIKGNISLNTGEKIYHLPGQEWYSKTKIDPAYGEAWFCTEAEARANSFRRSYE